MKKLLTLLKHINNFLNEKPTPKEEAELILKYLILKNSTTRSIEIYEELEIAMRDEMLKRETEAENIANAVKEKWRHEPKISIVEILVKDPVFEQPIKN